MAAMSFMASSNASDLPELFVEVDTQTERFLEKENKVYKGWEFYFAKRFQIVKINHDAMFSIGEKFTATVLGSSVTLKTEKLNRTGRGRIHWHGSVQSKEIIKINPPLTDREKTLLEQMKKVQMDLLVYNTDKLRTGIEDLLKSPSFSGTPPTYETVITLFGTFPSNSQLIPEYRVVALATDDSYHLVYEVDPEKSLGVYEGGENASKKQKDKMKKLNMFLEKNKEEIKELKRLGKYKAIEREAIK